MHRRELSLKPATERKERMGKIQTAMTQIEYNATTMAVQWHREMEYVVFLFFLFFFFCE